MNSTLIMTLYNADNFYKTGDKIEPDRISVYLHETKRHPDGRWTTEKADTIFCFHKLPNGTVFRFRNCLFRIKITTDCVCLEVLKDGTAEWDKISYVLEDIMSPDEALKVLRSTKNKMLLSLENNVIEHYRVLTNKEEKENYE